MEYQILLNVISQFIQIDEDDIRIIKQCFKPLSVKKNTVLIELNKSVNTAYFVNEGFLRYYKMTEEGSEVTIHLLKQGEFITSMGGFFNHKLSEEILHTITNAELLAINREDLTTLYQSASKWQEFGRKLNEKLLIEKEQRIIDNISLDAKTRYLKLIKEKGELVNNIPIAYIASFIGIHPESLSRIRKQI